MNRTLRTDRAGCVEWAVATRPAPGEAASGDLAMVHTFGDQCLLAVVDGLGHGPAAAAAAERTLAVFGKHHDLPIIELLRRAHDELAECRGAAATVAVVDGPSGVLRWLGVGNVDGVVVHRSGGAPYRTSGAFLLGGVLGQQLPTLYEPAAVQLAPGDRIGLATDGLQGGLTAGLQRDLTVDRLARKLLDEHASSVDDALVLVATYRRAPDSASHDAADSPSDGSPDGSPGRMR